METVKPLETLYHSQRGASGSESARAIYSKLTGSPWHNHYAAQTGL